MTENDEKSVIIRRERKYAIKAREQYNKDYDKQEFINAVWRKIKQYAKNRHVVENSTRALLELTKEKGRNSWVNGKLILETAKIYNYKDDLSYGLWPWLENTAAGIIQEQGEFPETSYRIKDEFYDILYDIVKESRS
jgi:hypothetical protein